MALGSSYHVSDAQRLVDLCDDLIASRSRIPDKEGFAQVTYSKIFGLDGDSVDLLRFSAINDHLHAEALNRLYGLIGFESTVFKTIYESEKLFDDFLRVFCAHAQQSSASAKEAQGSLYMWLLNQFLEHVLPISEAKLNFMKNSNWFAAPLSSGGRSAVQSPRRLLKPEVLASSLPLEHVALTPLCWALLSRCSGSASLRTLYPKLLQFVGNLVMHLCSLSVWPSPAQLQVLQVVIDHYNEFILTNLDDVDLASIKVRYNLAYIPVTLGCQKISTNLLRMTMLRRPFTVDYILPFLQRVSMNWPLVRGYCRIIDLWTSLVAPAILKRFDADKLELFMRTSSVHFLELMERIVQRILDSDANALFATGILEHLEGFTFRNPILIEIFSQHSRRGRTLHAYIIRIINWLATIRRNAKAAAMKNQRGASRLRQLFINFLHSLFATDVDLHQVERHINALQLLLNELPLIEGGVSEVDITTMGSVGHESYTTNYHLSILKPKVPEYEVNQWTKMLYLTPNGRMQVINRVARFDFQQYSKQISQTFPSMGVWYFSSRLWQWTQELSARLSTLGLARSLAAILGNNSGAKGPVAWAKERIADVMLTPASPPRGVPVFSKSIPKRAASLNLSPLASIPVVLALFLLILYVIVSFMWN